jgi:hypothetical protein
MRRSTVQSSILSVELYMYSVALCDTSLDVSQSGTPQVACFANLNSEKAKNKKRNRKYTFFICYTFFTKSESKSKTDINLRGRITPTDAPDDTCSILLAQYAVVHSWLIIPIDYLRRRRHRRQAPPCFRRRSAFRRPPIAVAIKLMLYSSKHTALPM